MRRLQQHNGKKPVAEVSSGSVTIPIYACPVTLEVGDKRAQNSAKRPTPNGNGAERKTYPSFQVVYYEGTQRVFRRRNTLAKAKALAKELAGQLASDGVRSQFLTEQDRRIYVLAQKAVQPIGVEIDQACRHYAELRNRVKGATLDEAVEFHNTFGQRVRHGAKTEEVYQEYLQHLEKRGAGDYHVRDVEKIVGRFVSTFPGAIARIDTPDIDNFLTGLGGQARNKNNWRNGIIAFFNFARKKNFLPKNLEHAAAAASEFSAPRHKIITEAVFPSVPWQRCQFHLQQNAQAYVPRLEQRAAVAEAIRSVFNSPTRATADQRLKEIVTTYAATLPKLAAWLEEHLPEGLTVFGLPSAHQRRLRTSNALERVNEELRRRTRVASLFPNEASLLRLVSALLQETSEAWEAGKVYLNMECQNPPSV